MKKLFSLLFLLTFSLMFSGCVSKPPSVGHEWKPQYKINSAAHVQELAIKIADYTRETLPYATDIRVEGRYSVGQFERLFRTMLVAELLNRGFEIDQNSYNVLNINQQNALVSETNFGENMSLPGIIIGVPASVIAGTNTFGNNNRNEVVLLAEISENSRVRSVKTIIVYVGDSYR